MKKINNYEKLKNANLKLDEWLINWNNAITKSEFIDYDEYQFHLDNFPCKLNFLITLNFNIFTSWFKYNKRYNNIQKNLNSFDLEEYNNKIAEQKIHNFKIQCGKIEDKNLDKEQINAIVRENKNELVLASAGSGKTTTIIGKVKYLINVKNVDPKEILVLSFTNSSASEMKDRIAKEIKKDINTYTFHKLGLEILKKCTGKSISICNKNINNIIKQKFLNCLNNSEYLEELIFFWSCFRLEFKDEFDFNNEFEYKEFLKTNPPTTLNGEIVKSYGELEIANFLLMNGIKYEYEQKYKYNLESDEYTQYRPDFYLPEHDIYIEYLGINKEGRVAPYFSGKNNQDASYIYNEQIKWKRNTHKKYGTKMIESYYYERKDGILFENLKKNLESNNIALIKQDYNKIWDYIKQKNSGMENELCNLFSTIINLIKSNNYTLDYVKNLCTSNNNKTIIELVTPLYNYYNSYLKEHNEIDFNDMINTATFNIQNNKYIHNYKYIIIDEYQDISKSRYNLLLAMRNQSKYNIFCVGDDRQSIYRFSGSDVSLIINFEKYWGKSYITSITHTYRFSNYLADISSKFIMRNPNQIKKHITGLSSNDFPLSAINIKNEKQTDETLERILAHIEKGSSVLLLGRYNHDIECLKQSSKFTLNYDNSDGKIKIKSKLYKDKNIEFMTIHKSKGLQSDYVILLNNKNTDMGFPSKINDLPIIELLLEKSDNYIYSEERRLFYVALTRARKKVLLISIIDNKSEFIRELITNYGVALYNFFENKTCSKCGNLLINKIGRYGPFMACINYPKCK